MRSQRDARVEPAYELRLIDVDADAALEARWGDKVPVLLDGDDELCHYIASIGAAAGASGGDAARAQRSR